MKLYKYEHHSSYIMISKHLATHNHRLQWLYTSTKDNCQPILSSEKSCYFPNEANSNNSKMKLFTSLQYVIISNNYHIFS